MITLKNKINRYIFPAWAEENKPIVLLCSIISCAGGSGGAVLLHMKYSLAGTIAWPIGLIALSVCFTYYIKGTYQKYLDVGWDVYY